MSVVTDAVKTIVETWNVQKVHSREFNTSDMYRFIELMNDRTRHMIRTFQMNDPEWYQIVAMVAGLAADITSGTAGVELEEYYPRAKEMIAAYGVNETDFYTGLQELCMNAVTQTTPGARLIADGVDRTQL